LKKRWIALSILIFALVILNIYLLFPIHMDSINCSYIANEEVTLVSEFVMIKNEASNSKSVGVLSFKVGDVLYGVGHATGLDENETYSVQRITPVFIRRTEQSLGKVLWSFHNLNDISFGTVIRDSDDGLVVNCNNFNDQEYSKIGIANEIISGEAELLMRDKESKLQSYSVTIEIVVEKGQERLDISITDERLKEKTEGIIPGMSGSPIIQNGKLVGVVSETYIYEQYKGKGKIIWNIDCVKENISKNK